MFLFCIRDTTDLADRAGAFEQAIPMDVSVPTYGSILVYCEAVRIQVVRTNTANLPD